MSRFARSIMFKFRWVCRSLELTLGPDTGGKHCRIEFIGLISNHEVQSLLMPCSSFSIDLALRIGMHSGPVTAGVLRGERARFQLFGDTVNTGTYQRSTERMSA